MADVVAMCSLTAASLLGCVGFKVGETMTTKSSYEGYIKEAATRRNKVNGKNIIQMQLR